ncbi:MAG: DNA-binding transcriptional regulator GbsR (MarR family) [Cognaticolwellia sp.]
MPENKLQDFVEHTGLYFEGAGLPGVSGRILGHLLVCDPAMQSSADLAKALETTSGSISTNTRLLLQSGLIEKVPLRGRRGTFFQVVPEAFSKQFTSKLAQTRLFRELLDEGIAVLEQMQVPVDRAERIREARALYAFFEREFPLLLARWEQERAALKRG